MLPFEISQYSGHPSQRARLNLHSVASMQVRPRLVGNAGRNQHLNRANLVLIYNRGLTIATDDLNHTRSLKDRKSVSGIESAKQVPGEKWNLYFLDSIRPALSAFVQRQKPLVSAATQKIRNPSFVLRSNL